MSNGWKLELLREENGDICLTFWDSLHGEDRCWIVDLGDSQIYHADNGEKQGSPIYDFGAEIQRLMDWLETRN